MTLPERTDLVYESRQFQQTEQLHHEVALFFYNPDTQDVMYDDLKCTVWGGTYFEVRTITRNYDNVNDERARDGNNACRPF